MTVNLIAMHLQLGVVFVTLVQTVITEKCLTPNNEDAECVPLHSCEILIDALFDGLFKEEQSDINEFVRKSKCEGRESDRMVCCGSTSKFSAPMITINNDDKDKLIPDRRYCGYQHSDDYFRNETTIGINEFPWLAGLIYKIKNESLIRCGGSLITNRYVLTGALCISTALVSVRLGEYNTKNDEDCTEEASFYECSEQPQDFDIEKMIRHPQYKGPQFHPDIGLLRLSKKVQYSDYIRPICLPTAGTVFSKPGDILLTSGWGSALLSASALKKKIYNVLITNEECITGSNSFFRSYANVNEDRFCTKELENNTKGNCQGDHGTPVIFSFRSQWHQEGVLSLSSNCRSSTPAVNIKVVNYLDWIKENIEP